MRLVQVISATRVVGLQSYRLPQMQSLLLELVAR